MSQQTTGGSMNGKTTLTVFKNSPHIWSGGLEPLFEGEEV